MAILMRAAVNDDSSVVVAAKNGIKSMRVLKMVLLQPDRLIVFSF